jgi:hypothetical protein
LLDEQPFHSAYSITQALGVSDSTMLSYLRGLLGLKIFICVDPAQDNDQFATDSGRNLLRVIAHSQRSREK